MPPLTITAQPNDLQALVAQVTAFNSSLKALQNEAAALKTEIISGFKTLSAAQVESEFGATLAATQKTIDAIAAL